MSPLGELMTTKLLRELAVGMPHRSEAKKAELIAWLRAYRPEVFRPEPEEES